MCGMELLQILCVEPCDLKQTRKCIELNATRLPDDRKPCASSRSNKDIFDRIATEAGPGRAANPQRHHTQVIVASMVALTRLRRTYLAGVGSVIA